MAEGESLLHCRGVLFDLAGGLHFIYKQVCSIVYVEDIEEVFHCEADAVEHFFAFRATYGDNHCASVAASGADEGLFQDVLVRPQALATVDENFCLCANGHKKYRRCENQAVGIEHLCRDDAIIIFNYTAAGFVTRITFGAGCDFEVRQSEIFGLCAG